VDRVLDLLGTPDDATRRWDPRTAGESNRQAGSQSGATDAESETE
jgi:hypothetical protein